MSIPSSACRNRGIVHSSFLIMSIPQLRLAELRGSYFSNLDIELKLNFELLIWKNRLKLAHVKMGIFIFLIALFAFGLGYIIGRDWNPAPIVIEQNSS